MTYQVEWREAGSGTLTGSASDVATEYYEVENLSPETDYEWRVRVTDGTWSSWLAFSTEALAGANIAIPSPIQGPTVSARVIESVSAEVSLETPLGGAQAFGEIIPITRPDIALPTPLGLPQVSGEVQYITPPALAPTDIAATEAWSLADDAYTVTWTWEHVANLSGVTGYAGTLSYGLVVVPFTSVGKTVAFTGVPANTLLTFEVWAVNAYGIGPSETGPFTTGGLPPALVTGIGYTATVDSLTFYWDPAARADSYEARLYRDGALVELQEPLTEDAVFLGLEDGITYEVEVRGVNAVSVGASGTREAITQYIAPTAPTNLRQEGSHWVLAKVYWDAPLSKVTFYESIVLLDGDEVFKSIVPVDPTERLFLLPKAGSTYQWKVRAGNPGGISAFAEIDIHTRRIEIDSRLAMLPSCYQEDYLFPDTWDGGTDIISEGVGDPQILNTRMLITEGRYRFQPDLMQVTTTPSDIHVHVDVLEADRVTVETVEPSGQIAVDDVWVGGFEVVTLNRLILESMENASTNASNIYCQVDTVVGERFTYEMMDRATIGVDTVWVGSFEVTT